jgi:hypothetical protein
VWITAAIVPAIAALAWWAGTSSASGPEAAPEARSSEPTSIAPVAITSLPATLTPHSATAPDATASDASLEAESEGERIRERPPKAARRFGLQQGDCLGSSSARPAAPSFATPALKPQTW